jgi:hypothetical protein
VLGEDRIPFIQKKKGCGINISCSFINRIHYESVILGVNCKEYIMNIFILSEDPVEAAQMQCDKHVVKMILESAQMLSTVHRTLDGALTKMPSKSGKTMSKAWILDDHRNDMLYKAVHVGHPCTVWTTESVENYDWHYKHFEALSQEYEYRYNRKHKSWVDLGDVLSVPPLNLQAINQTPFKLAMGAAPECINESDPVGSYRAFYQTKQDRFKMAWSKRNVPEWFQEKVA